MESRKRIVLGEEYDATLIAVVKEVLRELGAQPKESSWGMAGSQEVSRSEFEIDRHIIVLEAETYLGLSLEGEHQVVDAIVRQVRARLGDGAGRCG
jgi:hypothetical protein